MPTANAHAYQGQQQSIVKTSNMFVLMRTTWNSYLSLLNRYPMATQMVQAGVLMSAGDVISQVALEKQTGKMDTERTLRFAGLGVFLIVPRVRAAVTKVCMDQLLFAPIFQGTFITSLGVLQGKDRKAINDKLRREYKDVLFANWKVWPAVQLVNFFYVPFLLRPLVVSTVALFWNTYLSWKANRE